MPNILADNAAAAAAAPQTRIRANKQHGRIRIFESTVTVAAGTLVGETITWGQLPVGARVIGNLGLLSFAAGAASSTLNVGDAAVPARHLVATAVTSAGNAIPQAQSLAGASFQTSDNSVAATNNCTIISVVAGATLQTGQVITLRLPFALD